MTSSNCRLHSQFFERHFHVVFWWNFVSLSFWQLEICSALVLKILQLSWLTIPSGHGFNDFFHWSLFCPFSVRRSLIWWASLIFLQFFPRSSSKLVFGCFVENVANKDPNTCFCQCFKRVLVSRKWICFLFRARLLQVKEHWFRQRFP